MKTGVSFTDMQGTAWTVGQELGRGSFARSFVARSASGREAVVKIALTADDLFGDEAASLAAACSDIVKEQATFMRERHRPWLPDLLGEVELPSGSRGLLIPRYGASLATRLNTSATLLSVLRILTRAAQLCESGVHGNLRAENLLLAEDDRVVLTDPLTPVWLLHADRLRTRSPERPVLRPPEADGHPASMWDTYALCATVYQALLFTPKSNEPRREVRPTPPAAGLDKSTLALLKDKVLARLDQEQGNPRFAPRVADRVKALLDRGLSGQALPSPPYRFEQPAALRERLSDLVDLIDPRVTSVGKVLLSAKAEDDVFGEGEAPAFSTTVTCTEGITQEDLAAGLLVRDLDADGDDDRVPVPDAQYTVKPHPSGRLRFDFTLPELRPGRYTVRIAFAVKDSSREPITADGHFELRPPPGYVPPADEPPPEASALPFPASQRPSLGLEVPRFDEQAGLDDPFPTPIAPSDAGNDGDAPPPVLRGAVAVATDPNIRTNEAELDPPTSEPGASAHGSAVAAVPSIAPSAPTPPPAPAASPRLQVAPSLDHTLEAPSPTPTPAPSVPRGPEPTPAQGYSPGTWESLPSPSAQAPPPLSTGHDDLLDDLPDLGDPLGRPSGLPEPIQRLIHTLRDNPWIAMGVLMAGLVGLLLVTGILFQACAS
ncbi:MAG: hypothetical protein EA397_03400 [Deltaproteobacteria bacterium]|nr:MAG: hypothetical protein EA397_03400 [Deltaproteobacteria bacterium]